MTALRPVALACLLLAATASAADPQDRRLAAPPAEDRSPTGWSCTVETLSIGARCVFEGDAAAAETAPAWSMKEAVSALCAAAARPPGEAHPDAGAAAACEAEAAVRLRRCAVEGARLVDGAGRFLASARACYEALGEATARARTLAATLAPCCRCVAEARCGEARRSVKLGPDLGLSPKERACARSACGDTCGPYLPVDELPETPPNSGAALPAAPRFDQPPATKDL